jgi:hypothetical protein
MTSTNTVYLGFHSSLDLQYIVSVTWSFQLQTASTLLYEVLRRRTTAKKLLGHHKTQDEQFLAIANERNKARTQPPGTTTRATMNTYTKQYLLATSPAAAAPPSLLTQVGMAGTAAVITVSFIHPIDVVKVSIPRV